MNGCRLSAESTQSRQRERNHVLAYTERYLFYCSASTGPVCPVMCRGR